MQVAPGRYAGTFTPTAEGAYLIRVAGSDRRPVRRQPGAVAQTAGWVLSYSPEYQTLSADPGYLARLAALTGGGVVGEDLAQIYAHDLPAARAATRPVWPYLLLAAVLLLPLDIGVRRLVVTRYELQRGWRRLTGWLAPQPAAAVPTPRAQQLTSLFRAKDRAGTVPPKDGPPPTSAPPPIVTTPPSPAPPPAPTAPRPPAAPPAPGNTLLRPPGPQARAREERLSRPKTKPARSAPRRLRPGT